MKRIKIKQGAPPGAPPAAASGPSARDPALDAVRALAIVLVVMTHAASPGFSFPIGSGNWWGAMAWGPLARASVPLFFMCSGALMLGRDIPLRRLYGHNLVRLVAAMYVWALFYRVYHLAAPGGAGLSLTSLVDAVKHTLVLHHEFHFYFLHIMLLVYICLPVVRAFLRSASRREVEYALLVWFVTGILFPVLKDVWPFSLVSPISGWYLLPAAYSSIGYTMLGWYLRQYGGIARRWYLLSLACGAAFTFVSCSLLSLKYGVLAENLLSGWSPGPMLMSVGWFGLLLKVRVWPSRLRRGTGWLSRASFCIYLVHVCFLSLLRAVGITAGAGLTWLTIPGVTVLLLALSGLVYAVLCRIPVVKTYLI